MPSIKQKQVPSVCVSVNTETNSIQTAALGATMDFSASDRTRNSEIWYQF